MQKRHAAVSALVVALLTGSAEADPTDDDIVRQMRELESLRKPADLISEPQSVSVVDGEEIRKGRPAADLSEALDLVPGVFAQSSRNSAQDTRVSIRGFGSRARFGIRGVRVLVDGVPTTLPDGQTEIDSIDLAFVDHVEVVRGPISSLYGGGGGGIISLTTLSPTEDPDLRVRSTWGSHELARYEAVTRGRVADTGYVVGWARTTFGGYRDHASSRQNTTLAKLERRFGLTDATLSFSGVWSPRADDPGALNQGELDDDRKQARTAAHEFDTGEELDQQKVSLVLSRPIAAGTVLRGSVYGLHRNFENSLPFSGALTNGGQVDLDRSVYGASLSGNSEWRRFTFTTGIDVDAQRDLRKRYANVSGNRGELRFKQTEHVTSVGPFAELRYDFECGLGVVAGARYDWIEFDVSDRYLANGDQSDDRRFRQLSPRFGLYYEPRPNMLVYGNVSTSFEVPTTTEMRPVIGSGLDSDIDAESSLGYEIGVKGVLGDRLLYELVVFQIEVDDVLVPFEPFAPGDTFYRNAGETRRRGVELGLSAELRRGLSMRAGYTYADYEYSDYKSVLPGGPDFSGNREPNTSKHVLGAELRYDHPSGFFSVLALRHFTNLYVDDANSAKSKGATTSDARFGYDWTRDRLHVQPFFGVRNWSGVEYDGTIRPNGGFSRYFEPAPEVEVYGGLEVRLAFK